MRIFFMLVIAVVMAACSASQPIYDATTAAERLVAQYDGDIASLLHTTDMTMTERRSVDMALITAGLVRANFEKIRSEPATIIENLDQVEVEYRHLRLAYGDIRELAVKYRESYEPEVWATFEVFDRYAQQLDAQMMELSSVARKNEMLVSGIQLASSVVKIAAML